MRVHTHINTQPCMHACTIVYVYTQAAQHKPMALNPQAAQHKSMTVNEKQRATMNMTAKHTNEHQRKPDDIVYNATQHIATQDNTVYSKPSRGIG